MKPAHLRVRINPSIRRELAHLTGRYVHCGSSDLRAVRIVLRGDTWTGAPNRWRAFRALTKGQRRQTVAAILRAHAANQGLYVAVVRGQL